MQNERTTELEWPDFYPENCPSAGAKPASGKVCRLVRKDPAQPKDFIPLFLEKTALFKNKSTIEVCQGCGISVCDDLQDIMKLQRSSAKMRKRRIAEGELNPTLGKIQHTPSSQYKSHHTWWVLVGTEPWFVFNVISE